MNGKTILNTVSKSAVLPIETKAEVSRVQALFSSGIPSMAMAAAAKVGLIEKMDPLYRFMAEVIGALGTFAIMGGIIVYVFRRRTGTKILTVSTFAILAATLVPSIVLLLIIIGKYLNDTMETVLRDMN
jgi:nitrate reductase gamma subunit